jgi:hypothetical protein
MRIRPAIIIISAILALGAAGAAMSASEITAAATHASSAHVHVTDSVTSSNIMYNG